MNTTLCKRNHVKYCSAINCSSSRKKGQKLSFFRFPKEIDRCTQWIVNAGRHNLNENDPKKLSNSHQLCAKHFEINQFMNPIKDSLIWNAVPTLFTSQNHSELSEHKRSNMVSFREKAQFDLRVDLNEWLPNKSNDAEAEDPSKPTVKTNSWHKEHAYASQNEGGGPFIKIQSVYTLSDQAEVEDSSNSSVRPNSTNKDHAYSVSTQPKKPMSLGLDKECAALGCNNSKRKGKAMHLFPTNPHRRKLWSAKVNLVNWTPSNSSCLCEDHFDENQWEKDLTTGLRRLTSNAVPEIFAQTSVKELQTTTRDGENPGTGTTLKATESLSLIEMPLRSCAFGCEDREQDVFQLYSIPSGRRNEERRTAWLVKVSNHNLESRQAYLCERHFEESQFLANRQGGPKRLRSDAVPSIFGLQPRNCDPASPQIQGKEKSINSKERSVLSIHEPIPSENVDPSLNSYTQEIKDHKIMSLQQRVWTLQKQADDLRKALRRFFTPDQVQHLTDPKWTFWSEATIKDCLILSFVLGNKGYEYLYRKGYPIPSKQVLLERMKHINRKKSKSESLNDPVKPVESSSNYSVPTTDETTNKMSDNNETTMNLISNVIPKGCERNKLHNEGKIIVLCDLKPEVVNYWLVDVHSLNDNDESYDSSDMNHVLTSDKTNSNHATNFNETMIQADTNHITTSDETVNQADTNYVTNIGETVKQAETVVQEDANHVNNHDETNNLNDIEISHYSDETVNIYRTPMQKHVETITSALKGIQKGAERVNSPETGVCNEHEGKPMEWEISIEQDIFPCDIDNAGKSESAWQIALAALQMSAKDSVVAGKTNIFKINPVKH